MKSHVSLHQLGELEYFSIRPPRAREVDAHHKQHLKLCKLRLRLVREQK